MVSDSNHTDDINSDRRSEDRAGLIRSGLINGALAAFLTIGLAFGVSAALGQLGLDQRTSKNVELIVDEAEKNREALCLAILRPSLEAELPPAAWDRINVLCAAVDVRPAHLEP